MVRELRRELTERLTLWQRGREFTVDEEDTERARLAVTVVAEYADAVRRAGTPMAAGEERLLLDQVTAELVGLGRLQTLLVDDTIEEVHILGCDQVRITRHGGGVDWAEPIADSDDELVEILQAAARRAGATERSLSTVEAHPRPATARRQPAGRGVPGQPPPVRGDPQAQHPGREPRRPRRRPSSTWTR